MDLGLEGRTAFVPAASAGLGFAVARALAEEGARVAICGRNKDRIEAAATVLGPTASGFVADVSSRPGAAAAVAAARAALGNAIDILVLNGPGPPPGDFASVSGDSYGIAIDQGLLSPIEMCSAVIPGMIAQGWGRIVAITSITVRQPIHGLILSTTTRSALTGFLKTLSLEVARHGITVNSLQPGLHATARVTAVFGDSLSKEIQSVPAGRLGEADEFGRLATVLCSVHAAYVTGVALPVDGGLHRGLM